MKKGILISKIVFNVSVILLVLMLVGSHMAFSNSGVINTFLRPQLYKIIQTEDISQIDTEYFKSDYDSIAELEEATSAICAEIEEEGAVLLKNEGNALPLERNDTVSVFGVAAGFPVYTGLGSGGVKLDKDVNRGMTVGINLYDALTPYFTVNAALKTQYSDSAHGTASGGQYGRGVDHDKWPIKATRIGDIPWGSIVSAKNDSAKAAIYMIARVGGEALDLMSTERGFNPPDSKGNYLALSDTEKGVLSALGAAKNAGQFQKIILIINSANQIETDFFDNAEYGIDSVLMVGDTGTTGLHGVARIIAGDVNPSGRLTDAFWTRHSYNPVNANFGVYKFTSGSSVIGDHFPPGVTAPNASRAGNYDAQYNNYVVYQEGIYLGYRYAETRYEDYVLGRAKTGSFDYYQQISHPFGFGLSYSSFSYSNFEVSYRSLIKKYRITLDVKNEGTVDGKEVVQIYIQKPYIDNGIEKASVELIGYSKTDVIPAGGTVHLDFDIDEKFFASYDYEDAQTYVLDAGKYYLTAAKNSHDAVNNVLAAKGHSPLNTSNRMDATGNPSLVKDFTYAYDDETFSTSTATGNKITNLFDFADINRYEGRGTNSVKYMTRSDWEGTVSVGLATNANGITTILSNHVKLYKTPEMTQDQAHVLPGTNYILPTDDYDYPTYGASHKYNLIELSLRDDDGNPVYPLDHPIWEEFMDQLTWDETVDFLTLGKRKTLGIESIVKPETYDGNGPCGLSDGDFDYSKLGLATKKNDPDKDHLPMSYPSNGILAGSFNDDLAERAGIMLGEEALWAGYNGLYGTGVNMHRSPYLGRAFEYYSEDPIVTGYIVAYQSRGIQSKGCYVYNKHLVLNDQEDGRYGINTFANEQTIREIYLRAFEIPIEIGGAKSIMSGLNRIGVVWAAASKALCTDYIRGEAGLSGFIVTDWFNGVYMFMDSAILAGNDLPDGDAGDSGFTIEREHLDKYKEGYSSMAWAMRESAKRILFTVAHSSAMNGYVASTRIQRITPYWVILLYAINISLGVIAAGGATGIGVLTYLDRKKAKAI